MTRQGKNDSARTEILSAITVKYWISVLQPTRITAPAHTQNWSCQPVYMPYPLASEYVLVGYLSFFFLSLGFQIPPTIPRGGLDKNFVEGASSTKSSVFKSGNNTTSASTTTPQSRQNINSNNNINNSDNKLRKKSTESNLLKRRNLEARRNLFEVQRNQFISRSFVFTYYINWPRDTWQRYERVVTCTN